MKLDFRYLCLIGLFSQSSMGIVHAQGIEFTPETPEVPEVEEEVYVPPPPSEEDLRHYALVREAKQKWSALFADPTNAMLHLEVAKHYNILGSGDIALHELSRAEELGIPREELLSEIGRAYHHRKRYDDILNEITIDAVPPEDHGVVHLVRGHAYHDKGMLEQAFIHYYQADQLLDEEPLELAAPLARLYSDMGDYEKAEQATDNALEFAPKDAELLVLKGELVHRRAGAEQSYQYYERANFYSPDDLEIKSRYAAALYNLGRYDDMVVVIRQILAQNSRHAFANYLIAVNFARGGNIRTATRYLNQAGDAYDNFAPALSLKGKLGYATNSYPAAEEELKKLVRLDPDHGEGRRLLGAVLLQQEKYAEAVRVLDYLAVNNMAREGDYALLGSAYVLARDYDRGSRYLSMVQLSDPTARSESDKRVINEFEAGRTRGVSVNLTDALDQGAVLNIYRDIDKERYSNAIEKAAALVEQDRGSPIGYNLLGLAYAGQNKTDEARSNFRRAIGIDRDFHSARINLARLELKTGNRNESINYLNQILSRNERYLPAYDLLHEIAVSNGDMIAAERYLTTAATANSGLVAPRVKLFDFYVTQNNLSGARTTANRLMALFPDHAVSHKAAGIVSLKGSELDVARGHLEQSLMLDQRDLETYLQLAQVYQEMGRVDLIRPMLEQGLIYVTDKLPLQIRLVELARDDNNFENSHLYANQLKLVERTKAEAFIYEGELFLLQNRGEDAGNSFRSAIRAGADAGSLRDRLSRAEELTQQQVPVPEEIASEPPAEPSNE